MSPYTRRDKDYMSSDERCDDNNINEGRRNSAKLPFRRSSSSSSLSSLTSSSSSSSSVSSSSDLYRELHNGDLEPNRTEAPIPIGAHLLDLPGRDTSLPPVLEIPQHMLVPSNHRKIYMILVDYNIRAMTKLFETVANLDTPSDKMEAKQRGYVFLKPSDNDFLIMRDRFGTGEEKDDHIVSWSIAKKEHSEAHIKELENLRNRLLGPDELITPDKAFYDEDTDKYRGGIQIERSHRAVNVAQGPRCYQASMTFQVPKSMAAPGRQTKVTSTQLDDDAKLRKDLITLGAKTAMIGLKAKAPDGLLTTLNEQADITNLPRVGVAENVAYPAFQLNVASAVDKILTKEKDSSGTLFKSSLGKFAGNHLDGSDSAAVPTGMTILSKPHPDVEDEFFYILDCGIAWLLEEFSTVYFSGLHFHGGSQPTYKDGPRTMPDVIFYRLTLIAYPPADILDGKDAIAFAALPKKETLIIGLEMRNPISHRLSERAYTNQATFVSDGTALLDPTSYLNYFARNITELVAYITHQAPPELLLRFDKKKLISAFSMVIDKERVQPDEWENGPGWSDEDTRAGKDYTCLINNLGASSVEELSAPALALLYNSDCQSQAPYGNTNLQASNDRWAEHTAEWSKHIPLCVIADGLDEYEMLGARISAGKRKGAVRRARSGRAQPDLKHKIQDSKNKASKKKKKQVNKGKRKSQNDDVNMDNAEEEREEHDREEIRDEMMDIDDILQPPDGVETLNNETNSSSLVYVNQGFLSSFSEDALRFVYLSYQDSFSQDTSSKHDSLNFQALIGILNSMQCMDMRQIWKTYHVRHNHQITTAMELCKQKQELLILNMVMWERLEFQLEEGFNLYSTTFATTGLALLCKRIHNLLETRRTSQIFDAAEYLTDVPHGEVVYKYTTNNKRYSAVDDSAVMSLAFSILVHWYGFPSPTKFQVQAWFTRAIINHIGIDGLLLDTVWTAAQSINTAVLSVGRNCKISRAQMTKWSSTVLAKHPISIANSKERNVLKAIRDSINQHYAPDYGLLSFLNVNNCTPDAQGNTENTPAAEPGPLLVNDTTPQNSIDEDRTDLLPSRLAHYHPFQKLCRQIELLYPFLDNPTFSVVVPKKRRGHIQTDEYWIAKFREKVQDYSDKRLPFRDLATSRRRILEDGGPFSQDNVSTRYGFFSALVYRGITHGTQFLLDHQILFHDYEEWRTIYNQLKDHHGPKYFCRKDAYGRSTTRSVSFAEDYWRASGNPMFSKWLLSPTPIPFLQLFNLFKDAGTILPAFGSLTSYLLAVDYALAGKAVTPTPDEMGVIIHTIGKGGKAGLRHMGLSCKTISETKAAFQSVLDALRISIPVHRQNQMNFGVFFLEHMLCKTKRLDTSNFKNIK